MVPFEAITRGAAARGILPHFLVALDDMCWIDSDARSGSSSRCRMDGNHKQPDQNA